MNRLDDVIGVKINFDDRLYSQYSIRQYLKKTKSLMKDVKWKADEAHLNSDPGSPD